MSQLQDSDIVAACILLIDIFTAELISEDNQCLVTHDF